MTVLVLNLLRHFTARNQNFRASTPDPNRTKQKHGLCGLLRTKTEVSNMFSSTGKARDRGMALGPLRA